MNKDSLDFIFKPSSSITNELTVARMESLRKAALRAQPPKQVIGGKIRTTPDGWTLEIPKPGRPKDPFPLEPVLSTSTTLKFRFGTVHGIVPKIDEEELTARLDESPELEIDGSGKVYIKVDLAEDTYEATNPVIEFAETVPEDEDRVNAHAIIVDVEFDEAENTIKSFSPAHRGSIDMASCGGVINYWDLGY